MGTYVGEVNACVARQLTGGVPLPEGARGLRRWLGAVRRRHTYWLVADPAGWCGLAATVDPVSREGLAAWYLDDASEGELPIRTRRCWTLDPSSRVWSDLAARWGMVAFPDGGVPPGLEEGRKKCCGFPGPWR